MKSRPSVAIIGTRGFPSFYGGFETAVRKLAPYLADHGWIVTVYGRGCRGNTPGPDITGGVQVVNTLGIETKSLSTLSFGFTAVLKCLIWRPDVALVMNVANGFWLPLLWLRGIPTVVNVDGIEWERAKWGRLAKTVFRLGARLTARFASDLVSDSRAIRRRWLEDFGRESTFIPYGAEPLGASSVIDGLSHRKYVLVVARFVPENTIEEFLQAVPEIAQTWDVVIVGSSGYGGAFEDAAQRLDDVFPNVRWLGHVSDDLMLQRLWKHAGVYFHGHSVGGTNPALVQAMACGAPVVARDTVYNREVLGDNGRFVAADSKQIARVLQDMLAGQESLEAISSSLADRARHHYSWSAVCSAYEKALREAAFELRADIS